MSEKNVSCGGGAKQHEEHKNIWEKRFTEKAVQPDERNSECFSQTISSKFKNILVQHANNIFSRTPPVQCFAC